MPVFALTIFLGAFLLFQVQPLIGKFILPWFGGGPGVWTACLLFFQVFLLGGYAYAHGLARALKPRHQAVVHLTLLAIALVLLPITPGESWKPHGEGNPTVQILCLLVASLGLPYLVLAATGPLLQHWFSRARPGVSPYRLYALSNLGSLLALVSYPFYFEPNFTRLTQAKFWSGGLFVFAVGCAGCAVKLWNAPALNPSLTQDESTQTPDPRSLVAPKSDGGGSTLRRLLWLLLPACGSMLLLATTNKLCQDVAVIPFLWVLPLGLYLLSFVVAFDHPRWYVRPPFALALVAALAGMVWLLHHSTDLSVTQQLWGYGAVLFVCCLVCHGELFRLRPPPPQLTQFYLCIAAGGALGGVLVAVVAPLLFRDYFELHWALGLCGCLFLLVCLQDRATAAAAQWKWLALGLTLALTLGLDRWLAQLAPGHQLVTRYLLAARIGLGGILTALLAVWLARGGFARFRHGRWLACGWLALGEIVLVMMLLLHSLRPEKVVVSRSRNFYGTLKVSEYRKSDPDEHYFSLEHGRITHGLQFTAPERARSPVSYYTPGSGIGRAVAALPDGPRHLGVVGLGTGTMAAFARKGDALRLYEINPEVLREANSRFTYLSNCAARMEIVLGDARLSLEREPPQVFDLLALDAFSSDAIPVHLLTKEAFLTYERHVKTNGIIAVHISNSYLDLEPVVVNVAKEFGYHLAIVDQEDGVDVDGEEAWWVYGSTWVLLSHDAALLDSPQIREWSRKPGEKAVRIPLWTDDFASVFQILQ